MYIQSFRLIILYSLEIFLKNDANVNDEFQK
jgi:hypothetical protein